ncbi:hypothetical protein JXC34_01570 [Candidatus Woesearchaeota archaeon]|nr:hypothetical protein [Candidatus Woesearchaeota archaeon]
MKKLGLVLFISILMCSLVLAQGVHEPGTGLADPELKEAAQGTGQGNGTGDSVATATATEQQNKGEESQIQNQVAVKVMTGTYTANGKQVQIQEQSSERVQLKVGETSAETTMQMTQLQTQEGTKLSVKLSNGKDAEVKVMPDTASEKALERLRLKVCSEDNGCQIELKEVGSGEGAKAAYEVQAQKQAKFLGIFGTKMQVRAQVDAESGEVLQVKKPWWSFLASEVEE